MRMEGGTTEGLHGVLCDGDLSRKERLHHTACHLTTLPLTASAAFVGSIVGIFADVRLAASLHVLEQRSDALSDADAHRRQPVAFLAAK